MKDASETIDRCLESILSQRFDRGVEIIAIDGGSTDGTLEKLQRFESRIDQLVSEPDQGLYDAINKGLRRARGQLIGILNGDDYYADDTVLQQYAGAFKPKDVDMVFADLEYFSKGQPQRVRRRYSSANFRPAQLAWGWMPPHPTVFIRASAQETVGFYATDYEIAADYELLVRALLIHRLHFVRLNAVVVRMQLGGVSTSGLRATYVLNREIIRACRENGVKTNWMRVLSKYPKKLAELFVRKRSDRTS